MDKPEFKDIETPWGEIGLITFSRTYARRLKENDPNSKTEEFKDVILRELNACEKQLGLYLTKEEKEFFYESRMQLLWSTGGRFLWQLGTKTVDKLGLPSLQNCAVTIVNSPIRPFTWAMEMLLLGSGVGYNIQKHNVYQLPKLKSKIKIIREDKNDVDFIVPDNREGWVKLLGKILKAHFYSGEGFTYSLAQIRGKGALIKGFGGIASGPEELHEGIQQIHEILNTRQKQKLRPIDCLDIMNIIGAIVVSGNVRRSAQIAIGDCDDNEFLKAKRWDLGQIPNWRALSNNSVVCSKIEELPKEFWDTYAQGEPYGLINLELSRKIGRTGEYQYPDPNVEAYNPCVSGETEILTQEGYKRIDSLVNQNVNIWNGFEWSNVIPKITGHNQPMLKITLSDGRELDCTTYHKWHLALGYTHKTKEVKAKDLKIGDKIIKYNFPIIEGGEEIDEKIAYTQGFISAEGMDDYNHFWLYEPKMICKNRLDIRLEGAIFENINNIKRQAIYYNGNYENKDFVPFNWNKHSKLQWIAGLFDGDGTELIEGGLQLCSTDKLFLIEVQKLLSTLGVNSKIVDGNKEGNRNLPNGKGGLKEYFCNATYRICIGATQMQELKSLGLKCERMDFNKTPQRDASQFVRVVKIEDIGRCETVYCFNEPLRHYGVFNGILTGQCAEQSLENFETCCLGEIFLPNIKSYDIFLKCIEMSYRVCKHSLTLPCSLKETEEIVHKNMRMGIGITGILQATDEQRSWFDSAYKWLREYDITYSKKHNFPTSIKLTTCKPSGTLSLLAGVTPGVHPNPAGPYYLRRIRISSNSNLLNVCKQNGYKIEPQLNFDGSEDKNTMVVAFPCKLPESTPVAANYSWKEQLEMIKLVQSTWSDNSVSCTVYYKKEDLEEIKEYLKENYSENFKTLSFLLYHGHGFIQAPYETITKEEYEKLIEHVKPITSVTIKENDVISTNDECESGACPIK